MPLFRRKPEEPLPGPDARIELHLDAILAGRDGAVPAYIRALAARDLWVAAQQLPDGVRPGEAFTTGSDTVMSLLGTTMPDGRGRALQLFTSQAGVNVRTPLAFPVKMPGRDALGLVLRSYDGAVVDPHDRWQGLASAWIADALGEQTG